MPFSYIIGAIRWLFGHLPPKVEPHKGYEIASVRLSKVQDIAITPVLTRVIEAADRTAALLPDSTVDIEVEVKHFPFGYGLSYREIADKLYELTSDATRTGIRFVHMIGKQAYFRPPGADEAVDLAENYRKLE